MLTTMGKRCAPRGVWLLVCTAMLCCYGVARAEASDATRFNADGFLMVDDRPRFILGMYELPKDEAQLAELAANGFNLVHVANAAGLDRLKQHNLYGWITISTAIGEDDQAGRDRIGQTATAVKDHPSMLVWELPDEALWNVWYGRHEAATNGELASLEQAIEAAADASDQQRAGWTALLEQVRRFQGRALWDQRDAAADQLWKELGKANPTPDARYSHCVAKSIELADAMARGCEHLRQVDPKHPIWLNHAPRNSLPALQRFNRMGDAAGCDIYPAPPGTVGHSDLVNQTLSSVGEYTDRMRAGAPGKSVWMVLQGFGWRDINERVRNHPAPNHGRRPNWHETQFMAYNALTHGANAILYWGTAYVEKDGSLWADLMHVARRIAALEPAIVGQHAQREPVAVADESFGSIDPDDGPRLMLRKTGDDWVLIAVNERNQPVAFSMKDLPEELEGKTLFRLYSNTSFTVADGGFRDGLGGHGVEVYATSRRFEAKDPL